MLLIRQYRSILVPISKAQAEMAMAKLSSAPPASKTVVVEGGMFTVAEQRHQKNRLRRDPAMVRCLVQSGQDDLTSSHLATRLNGWGSREFPKIYPFCAGFLVEKARWHNSTRNGRILASVRTRQLMWEEPLLKEVNFCLSALMTQSQTIRTDFAEVWNRSDSKNLYWLANAWAYLVMISKTKQPP